MTSVPKVVDPSTEQRIKDAARVLFLEKGYAATTTRDIAKAADMNVALINYYFRSKENLFAEIMIEQLRAFASGLSSVMNDPTTDLRTKILLLAEAYTSMLERNPDTPLFILTEFRRNPDVVVDRLGISGMLKNSVFVKQVQLEIDKGTMEDVHPVHLFMNLLSLLVFPVVAKPLLMAVTGTSDRMYTGMVRERSTLVPAWIDAMFFTR